MLQPIMLLTMLARVLQALPADKCHLQDL